MKTTAIVTLLVISGFNHAAWGQASTNEEQITTWFQQYLGKAPTPQELTGYTFSINQGFLTLADVEIRLLAGDEFYRLAGNTHEGYIKRLFEKTSLPTPNQQVINQWHNTFDTFPNNRPGFVKKFLQDTESLRNSATTQKLTPPQQIRAWFQQYLGKSLSDAEVNNYLFVVNQGFSTLTDIEVNILSGDEFYRLAGNTHEGYIKRLFEKTSLPTPNQQAIDQWHNTFDTFPNNRPGFVRKFLKDTEPLRLKNSGGKPDFNSLVADFKNYLGREPTPAEKNRIRSELSQPGKTTNQFRAEFLSRTEYFNRTGGDHEFWVESLYNKHQLPRPNRGEIRQWTGRLNAIALSQPSQSTEKIRELVALEFLRAKVKETPQQPKTKTRAEKIAQAEAWHKQYLGADPNTFEKSAYLSMIDSGTKLADIQVEILAGTAFYQASQSFDLTFIQKLHKAVTGKDADFGEVGQLMAKLTVHNQAPGVSARDARKAFTKEFLKAEGKYDHDHDHDHAKCIEDTFTAANGTQIRVHQMTKGTGWIVEEGFPVPQIQSNRLELAGSGARVITTGLSGDGVLTCTVRFEAGPGNAEIIMIPFRYQNKANHWRVQLNKTLGQLELKKREQNVDQTVSSQNMPFLPNVDYHVEITLKGSQINVKAKQLSSTSFILLPPANDNYLAVEKKVGCWTFASNFRFKASFDSFKFCEK